MNANQIAVYEGDQKPVPVALGDLAEDIAALDAELVDARVPGDFPPSRSRAYRKAAPCLQDRADQNKE